jgi:hypothetical protein
VGGGQLDAVVLRAPAAEWSRVGIVRASAREADADAKLTRRDAAARGAPSGPADRAAVSGLPPRRAARGAARQRARGRRTSCFQLPSRSSFLPDTVCEFFSVALAEEVSRL